MRSCWGHQGIITGHRHRPTIHVCLTVPAAKKTTASGSIFLKVALSSEDSQISSSPVDDLGKNGAEKMYLVAFLQKRKGEHAIGICL